MGAIFWQKSSENRDNSGMILNNEIQTTIVLSASQNNVIRFAYIRFEISVAVFKKINFNIPPSLRARGLGNRKSIYKSIFDGFLLVQQTFTKIIIHLVLNARSDGMG